MQILQQQGIHGLFAPTTLESGKLVYSVPAGIPLKKYLKGKISKQEFFRVFVQVLEITRKMEGTGLNVLNLMLDLEYVFVNNTNRMVQMLYQPIANQTVPMNPFIFLYKMIQSSSSLLKKDGQALNALGYYLKQMTQYSAENIENYIGTICPEMTGMITASRQIGTAHSGVSVQPVTPVQPVIPTESAASVQPVIPMVSAQPVGGMSQMGTIPQSLQRAEMGEEDQPTVMLVAEDDEPYPYLTPMGSTEHIEINKDEFWIGKDRTKVDYCVQGNPAVSRRHACIKKNGQQCFLLDNDSTNKTFVNNIALNVGQAVELKDGDKVVFANASYEFHTV